MNVATTEVVSALDYTSQSNVARDLGQSRAGLTRDIFSFNLAEWSMAENAMRAMPILIQTWLPSPLACHKALEGQYIAVLEEDEDGGFVATIPTLRGCISEGDDEEQALHHLKDALDGWLDVAQREGLRVPPPDKVRSL